MKKPIKSEFEAWFIEQHGKRPSKLSINELDKKVEILEMELSRAKWLMDSCAVWDVRKTSALWAWQVTNRKAKGPG